MLWCLLYNFNVSVILQNILVANLRLSALRNQVKDYEYYGYCHEVEDIPLKPGQLIPLLGKKKQSLFEIKSLNLFLYLLSCLLDIHSLIYLSL